MTSSWPSEEYGGVTRETVVDGVPRACSGFQTHRKDPRLSAFCT